jgi:hypothetical protein
MIAMQLYNTYRKGLQLFAMFTRDGHPKGLIWAGSAEAALGRAERIAGSGATVGRA